VSIYEAERFFGGLAATFSISCKAGLFRYGVILLLFTENEYFYLKYVKIKYNFN